MTIEKIKNKETYLNEMSKGMEDKVYFFNKIEDCDIYVDFGCADGELLKYLYENYCCEDDISPKFIGYDIDKSMIAKAKANCKEYVSKNIFKFIDDFDCIKDYIAALRGSKINTKVCLILSSVIHEVYAYSKEPSDIVSFWNSIFDADIFDYICIRDMALNDVYYQTPVQDLESVTKRTNAEQIRDFENNFGSLNRYNNFIHFLMKYRYTENWSREVKENYFPLTIDQLYNIVYSYISPTSWKIWFQTRFSNDFTINQIYDDFGVKINEKTHYKLILKNGRDLHR